MNWKAGHEIFCTPYFIETFPRMFENFVLEIKREEDTGGGSFIISAPRQILCWSY